MIRFFEVFFVFTRYSTVYLLVKLKIYKKPNEKILKNFFEDAGGAFIKFGQLLALRVDFLPQAFALEMLDLLDNVAPFSYSDVHNIFLKELGAAPEKIFYDFQKKPFASASFGQVHGAKISENEIVIVKVLRPGIETKVKVDLFIIKIFAYLMNTFLKINAMPWKEFYQELAKWTTEELDYRIEARNGQKLADVLVNDDQIVIPKIYHQITTRGILVEEYIEGVHLNRVLRGFKSGRLNEEKLLKIGIDIKKMQKIISMAIFKQFFVYGIFHADPHPGNIILLPNEKIAFVDFGIVGVTDRTNFDMFVKIWEYAIDFNIKEAAFYTLKYAGRDIKQIIMSAFPATFNEDYLDEFLKLLAEHFSREVSQLVESGMKEVASSKKDIAALFIEIIKEANRYKVKVPKTAVVFLRMFTVKSMLSKQIDRNYVSKDNLSDFYKAYPPEILIKKSEREYIPRMSREEAIEKLNNWLSHLLETDPKMYALVQNFVSKYNFINA
jgi:ubiquinone biosynthesis protein